MGDVIDQVRNGITDRVELPGMTLMEHLDELRKRLINVAIYLVLGFAIAYAFHNRLVDFIQKPLHDIGVSMNMSHPTDGLILGVKTAFFVGAIGASPFVLYQLWLFIAPGLYANEKKYVFPFMGSTVGLFLGGAWFGYRWVLPGAIKVLVVDYGKGFTHVIAIDEYVSFFLAVILGLGICFELPIIMFFLALLRIVDAKFFAKQWRYAILVIFLITAFICPLPDPIGMCLFASPMLMLYVLGIGVAWYAHPSHRKRKDLQPS